MTASVIALLGSARATGTASTVSSVYSVILARAPACAGMIVCSMNRRKWTIFVESAPICSLP